MNYSKQREIILETLAQNPIHPTAEKLNELIKNNHPETNIGIATIYRNLTKLVKNGIIKRINGIENAEHFDHNIHNHYHFHCSKCKKIFDINSKLSPDIIKKIEDNTGFKITDYEIIFHGICKKCR